MPKSEHRHASPDERGGAEGERVITPAVYANRFEIGHNAFEFLFDFGQEFEAAGETRALHLRVATAPAYAKAFRALLDQSIDQYEALFGPIAEVSETEGDRPDVSASEQLSGDEPRS